MNSTDEFGTLANRRHLRKGSISPMIPNRWNACHTGDLGFRRRTKEVRQKERMNEK
jgi:hypothetical protein